MRSQDTMFKLILETARDDDRIRAVILNGSRANVNAPKDQFQDFDIVYLVTDVTPFQHNEGWITRFGELMIMQTPSVPHGEPGFVYLMQFADGNRIDLTLYPVERAAELPNDSLSVLLLDKDHRFEPFPPATESDYLPKRPTANDYAHCCNEFWWVSTYVAKGLARREITYAKGMMAQVVHPELMRMLTWYIGIKTDFAKNPGKLGKYFRQYLEPELWPMLLQTYANANYNQNWQALFTTANLFRRVALVVGEYFEYNYPLIDDQRVSAYLQALGRYGDRTKN